MQFHIIQFTKTFLSVIFFALFMTLILHPFLFCAERSLLLWVTSTFAPLRRFLFIPISDQSYHISSDGFRLQNVLDCFFCLTLMYLWPRFSVHPQKSKTLFLNVHESTTKKESKLEANIEKEKQSQVFKK